MVADQDEKWRLDFRAKYGETIDAALKILKPGARYDECRELIEYRILDREFELGQKSAISYSRTKPAKLAAGRLGDALRRVDHLLKDKNLDVEIELCFPKGAIVEWLARCQELAAAPSLKKAIHLQAEKKRRAVQEARGLMQRFGSSDVAISAKPGGDFCRLAAVLYGEPNADLRNQCRVAVRKKRGSK